MASTLSKTSQKSTTTQKSSSSSSSKTVNKGKSTSTGKSYASGEVSQQTQQNKNLYSNPYQQSEKVTNAYNQLQNVLKNKPGQFQSSYKEQLDDIYNRISNREKFNFDMNESVLYGQLKDQYSSLGKLAMQDTIGQASAMTGGYGNSYAQTAGQQTYQNYMQQLQEELPNLYSMELQRYNQEGEDLYNQYAMSRDLYNDEYGQYRDTVGDWQTDRGYYTSQYQDERDYDYNQFANERSFWNDEYWKEKNAEQTTKSTTKSTDTSKTKSSSKSSSTSTTNTTGTTSSYSGGGGRSRSGSGSGRSSSGTGKGGSNEKAAVSSYGNHRTYYDVATNSQKSRDARTDYFDKLYKKGKINEANYNYYVDLIK